MKKLSILMTILFSIIFTFPSYGDWVKVKKNMYVNLDRIRNIDGYTYFWMLEDIPTGMEHFDKYAQSYYIYSLTKYFKGDCKLFRSRLMIVNDHEKRMGKDIPNKSHEYNRKWIYPLPNSNDDKLLNKVCNHIK